MSEIKLIGSPKCPDCDSSWVMWRKTLEKYVCRRCGCEWKDQETAIKLRIQRIKEEIALKTQELNSLKLSDVIQ